MATVSQVRQNYAEDSEKGVNKQINMELYAMYTYLSMVRSV
jgi:ferritin heavy chain